MKLKKGKEREKNRRKIGNKKYFSNRLS